MFVCPCCQGFCDKKEINNQEKYLSLCNFNWRLSEDPRSFINSDIYWLYGKTQNK